MQIYEFLKEISKHTGMAWDCACGNGQVAQDLVNVFSQVIATDVSEEQVKHATQHERINYLVSPAEHTSFDDEIFDCVCVAQALHWFDHEHYWAELDRVLKPGGVFAYWGYNFPSVSDEVNAELDTYLYPVINDYWATENQLLWDQYQNIDAPYAPIETPRIDLVFDCNLPQFINYLHTWSAVRRCMDVQGDAFFVELANRLARHWPIEQVKKVDLGLCFFARRKPLSKS